MPSFGNKETLLQRLLNGCKRNEKFTFLLGSGLTLGSSDGKTPGVSSVSDIIASIRNSLSNNGGLSSLEKELAIDTSENEYQKAMKVLLQCEGQEKLNEIIAKSVLKARIPSSKTLTEDENQIQPITLEKDYSSWHLREGVDALGKIYVNYNDTFCGPILTSNFDPLIEISIRKNGGIPGTINIPSDGSFMNVIAEDSRQVVHFHGYWNGSDTLHTADQITRSRPQLKGSLRQLLNKTTLVVVAYGGWDDALTRALIDIVSEGNNNYNVLWTFYTNNDDDIIRQNHKLIDGMNASVNQRVVYYKDIDCNSFFTDLWVKLNSSNEVSIPTSKDNSVEVIVKHSNSRSQKNKAEVFFCDPPPDINRLIGRDKELQGLSSSNFKVVFISGIGGQGKSGLAAHYVKNIVEHEGKWLYWDWRDFKEEDNRFQTKIISVIERLTEGAIRANILIDESIDKLIDLFFKQLGNKRIVFVFDNIDYYIDLEKFTPTGAMGKLFEAALRYPHSSKFIFTCRPEIQATSGNEHLIHLTGLSVDETRALFDSYNLSINEADKKTLTKIGYEITQGHPLWLTLVAGQALRGREVVFKFLEDIKNNIDLQSSNLADNTLKIVWKSLNPKQQTLLRAMAETIGSETEENLLFILKSELNQNQFRKALRALRALNLIEIRSSSGRFEELDLHPLVRHFVRNKFQLHERSKYITLVVRYYDQLIVVLKKTLSHTSPLSTFQKWTNKVELEVAKMDFKSALATLQEISFPIVTAGHLEEYYRVLKIVFERIDWHKAIMEEYEYFDDQLEDLLDAQFHLGYFEDAKNYLNKYVNLIPGKSKQYLQYCKGMCELNWFQHKYPDAIIWGEKGLELKKTGNIDLKLDLEHSLALALRDSKTPENMQKALLSFLKGEKLEDILKDDPTIDNDDEYGAFYGNIGRCLFFMNKNEEALFCYKKSMNLLLNEFVRSSSDNRGYGYFWIGELLESIKKVEMAYYFYKQAIFIWEKISIPRLEMAQEVLDRFLKANKLEERILQIRQNDIEKNCKKFIES